METGTTTHSNGNLGQLTCSTLTSVFTHSPPHQTPTAHMCILPYEVTGMDTALTYFAIPLVSHKSMTAVDGPPGNQPDPRLLPKLPFGDSALPKREGILAKLFRKVAKATLLNPFCYNLLCFYYFKYY